jgi:hypothetical protein
MQNTYTTYNGKSIVFDVIVDETLHDLAIADVNPNKKALLGLSNDFEGGKWRKAKFDNFIWDNIKETALSKSERDALIDREFSSLTKSASNVKFTENDEDDEGGEIGEILLYGIMKNYYSALPVVPKIFYKQNKQDYVKGADSVHIVLEEEGIFSLWLGEAKFYNTLDDNRFNKIVNSVNTMLDGSKLRKELNIVTSLGDLELLIHNSKTLQEIKDILSDGVSLDNIKKRLHIPILLLHECEITLGHNGNMETYKAKIKQQHLGITQQFMKKQESKLSKIYGYGDIYFHLILFPVPNKTEIVNSFRQTIVSFKED